MLRGGQGQLPQPVTIKADLEQAYLVHKFQMRENYSVLVNKPWFPLFWTNKIPWFFQYFFPFSSIY